MVKNVHIFSEKGITINRVNVHKIISALKNKCGIKINSLEINFISSLTIHGINKEFLGHNYPTDVISFNYSNESNNLDGEIFVCYEVASENAKLFKVTLDNELKRLIIHGILHLIGYDDISTDKRKEMKLAEDRLLTDLSKIGKVIKK